MKKTMGITGLLACLALLSGVSQLTQAAFLMSLEDTTSSGSAVTITDNGSGDSNATADQIQFSGSVGNFVSNVSTGLFTSASDRLDLSTLATTGGAGGTLEVRITRTGLTSPAGLYRYIGFFGGSLASPGTVGYKAWIDTTDTAFGMETQLGDISDTATGGFSLASIDGMAAIASGVPYSLTLLATVTLGVDSQASFDAGLSRAVPEPATAWLFALGLLGLLRRRLQRTKG